ncbi:MAG: M56 family metallopeptidase [Terriglobales bacterium]
MIVPQIAAGLPHYGLLAFGLNSAEGWAQIAIERVIHSLPEGLLIALFAWGVLRILPKQNSRTRFAVWFVALIAVVGLACVGGSWYEIPHSNVAKSATLEWGTHAASGWAAHSFSFLSSISSRVSEIHLPGHWAGYLFIAWLAIAFLGMTRLATGLWHLRALRLSCSPVNAGGLDPAVAEEIAAAMQNLNGERSFTSRHVTLATSERVRVPAALGLWSPMIVLPAWALAELPASELSIILRHEFAHLRRWDDWTNLVQKVVRAVFFFHPAVWWIESRLSVEREMACDDIVVAETDNPMGYANCLVSLLERSLAQRGWTMAQAIVHRAREASERVAQILDKNRPAARGISKPALGLVGTFAALCVVMLPATPQFVAFDRETGTASTTAQGYPAGLVRSASLRTADYRGSMQAAVIPAGLKSDVYVVKAVNTNSVKTSRRVSPGRSRNVVAQLSDQASNQGSDSNLGDVATRDHAASLNPAPAAESLIPVNPIVEVSVAADRVAADQEVRPAAKTLLFVREAHFVTAEFPVAQLSIVSSPQGPVMVWSVQMMRVTFVAPVWKERAPLSASKKT